MNDLPQTDPSLSQTNRSGGVSWLSLVFSCPYAIGSGVFVIARYILVADEKCHFLLTDI